MGDGTVMVVEDDAFIRDAVVEILAVEGFVAVGVKNGEEALARLRHGRALPSVILLDLMMPVMNGWQFRAEQLKDPALARIPVVVMSASDEARFAADAHFEKPFDIDALLRTVASLTRSAGLARQASGSSSSPAGTCRIATEFMQ